MSAVPPDSGDLLASYKDGHHCVWPIKSGSPGVLTAHRSFVYPAVFSKDGSTLLTGGWDGAAGFAGGLKVWDARTGVLVAETGLPGEIYWSADFTPDGRFAVAGVQAANRRTDVIDLLTGTVRAAFRPSVNTSPESTNVLRRRAARPLLRRLRRNLGLGYLQRRGNLGN